MQLITSFVTNLYARLLNMGQDEEGQTLVEYGLIVALLSIVAIAVLITLGTTVSGVFNSVAKTLSNAIP